MSLFTYLRDFIAKYSLNKLDIANTFEYYFFDHKYYLHQNSSTENFARLLNINPKIVDQISLDYHGVNFITLISQYRYQHIIKELENPINSNLSMESIIELSGFENIDTFYNFINSTNLLTEGIIEEKPKQNRC